MIQRLREWEMWISLKLCPTSVNVYCTVFWCALDIANNGVYKAWFAKSSFNKILTKSSLFHVDVPFPYHMKCFLTFHFLFISGYLVILNAAINILKKHWSASSIIIYQTLCLLKMCKSNANESFSDLQLLFLIKE